MRKAPTKPTPPEVTAHIVRYAELNGIDIVNDEDGWDNAVQAFAVANRIVSARPAPSDHGLNLDPQTVTAVANYAEKNEIDIQTDDGWQRALSAFATSRRNAKR